MATKFPVRPTAFGTVMLKKNVARWVAAIQLAADTWGLAPVAFPGMEQPDR